MASMPGILTDWPWKPLGSFKYLILSPWIWKYNIKCLMKEEEMDVSSFMILPLLVSRMLHNQLWISLSRHRTAKGNNRIVDKGIEFEQVDRERNWDDQILFNGILFYVGVMSLNGATHLPMWRWDGVILTTLLHMGPVEFLYYWFHRALHHHFLYSRYHSHHHSSVVTEPITSVTHPFAEHIVYFMLFAIPMLTSVFTGTASVISFAGYLIYIDFMNNMGHCNFELIPKCLFSIFPPLKYLMYTPSFHSLHHTQFRTNYSLFMPLYDYIYGTTDKSTDILYENSLKRPEETPDVVHLTHLTTPNSIYHLRLGFPFLASRPYTSYWYLWLVWPITLWTMLLNWIYGNIFVVERLRLYKLRLQTWIIPKYNIQYLFKLQSEATNNLIEEAILEADKKGVRVLSLGLLNQNEELNEYGEVYIERNPKLKTKVVDGSGVAVAVVLNNIPKGTTEVLFRGTPSKVALAVVFTLCHKGIQVAVTCKDDYDKLKRSFGTKLTNLNLAKTHSVQIWLVGDGLTEQDQKKAPKGTLFIPFSQFPPKRLRKDCYYHTTPAMVAPKFLENIDSCENWLPRRVMSAWRVGGIVHALEDWNGHECGRTISDIDKVWEATLRHGFKPLYFKQTTTCN